FVVNPATAPPYRARCTRSRPYQTFSESPPVANATAPSRANASAKILQSLYRSSKTTAQMRARAGPNALAASDSRAPKTAAGASAARLRKSRLIMRAAIGRCIPARGCRPRQICRDQVQFAVRHFDPSERRHAVDPYSRDLLDVFDAQIRPLFQKRAILSKPLPEHERSGSSGEMAVSAALVEEFLALLELLRRITRRLPLSSRRSRRADSRPDARAHRNDSDQPRDASHRPEIRLRVHTCLPRSAF